MSPAILPLNSVTYAVDRASLNKPGYDVLADNLEHERIVTGAGHCAAAPGR
jgi:hypothetical protein